jgi:glycosyltransferase involved in cell wall biosynthesis
MIVGINMVLGTDGGVDGHGNFLQQCFSILAKEHPQDQFIYIVDRPLATTAKNITIVIIDTLPARTLLWRYWLDYKLSAIIKKQKVDVLVNAGVCSLRTKIPQCLIINDLSFLHIPQFLNKSQVRFYKKLMPKFLAKAKQVVSVSQFSKATIIEHYKVEETKISVVYSSAGKKFQPVDWKEKETIKEKYTTGKEYFLFSGNIHPAKNMLSLLKAFSHFKKWQKSNMQLVIAGTVAPGFEKFTEDLATYKYRNEVVVVNSPAEEELVKITAAAYALVYPSSYEDFGTPPLQAMQSEVPVIAGNAGAMPEIYSDAALYATPDDLKAIATQMMLLFKY